MPFSTGMRLATRSAVMGVVPPASYSSSATTDIYVSLKQGEHVTFVIYTGAWAAGTAAITLLQATSAAAGGAKALTSAMPYMYTNKAAPTKSTFVETAVVSDTFNLDTAASVWLVEVDAASLDVANGFCYVALHGATPGANADFYSVIAIITQGRYTGASLLDQLA